MSRIQGSGAVRQSPLALWTVFVLGWVLCGFVHGADPVSTSFLGNQAIGGKDTVSYHAPEIMRNHAVLTGDARFEVTYLGAKWRFASKDSADRFAANPARFVPRYNGFCANALALGEGLVKTDGEVWEFFGDTLYLFYAEGGRQRWLKGDWRTYARQADAAWQAQLGKR